MNTRVVSIGGEKNDQRRAVVIWQDSEQGCEHALMLIEYQGSISIVQDGREITVLPKAVPELCRQLRESGKRAGAA